MAFGVRLTRAAAADLVAIRAWLSQPGAGRTAGRRLKAIGTAIGDLRGNPTRWPVGEHPGTRARTVEGHRIVYRITLGDKSGTGQVDVLRIFGPGQSRDEL